MRESSSKPLVKTSLKAVAEAKGKLMKPTNDSFMPNEFYETLIRVRDSQPRRYARQISPGLKVAVERYERRKQGSERKKAA